MLWITDKLYGKKTVLGSLFNKTAVPRTRNFIKEDSDTGGSPWNLQTFRIYKFSEKLFWRKSVNVCFWTLFKKRLQHRCFAVDFVNYSRTPILYFSVNFVKFSGNCFYRTPASNNFSYDVAFFSFLKIWEVCSVKSSYLVEQ